MIGGGPSRASQPANRRAAYRTESSGGYHTEVPQPTSALEVNPAAPQSRQPSPRLAIDSPKKANPNWLKWLVGLLVLAVLMATAWFVWPDQQDISATIDQDNYQAVFLSNGQVYFGKLSILNGSYMKLTNVYYLERQLTANSTELDEDADSDADGNNFQLLKYSDVLYGSEDAMIISSDEVIRYENLRSDGVVARAINNQN